MYSIFVHARLLSILLGQLLRICIELTLAQTIFGAALTARLGRTTQWLIDLHP